MAKLPAIRPRAGGTLALIRALLLALCLAQAGLTALTAQERALPEAILNAGATPLTVAWCALDAAKAPAEYAYLASSLPRLLRDATLFADSRLLSAEEESGLAGRSLENERTAAHKELVDAIQKRDAIALQERDPARRWQELRLAEATIDRARQRYETSALAAPSSIAPDASDTKLGAEPRAESIRLLTPWKGAEGRLLLEARGLSSAEADLAKLCDAQGIGYLFYGELKSAGSFLQVELALYSAALRGTVWRGVEYSAPDALESLAELFIRPAARALLGRDYARLFVELEPPNATMLAQDGKPVRSGQLFFDASLSLLTLSAPGYEPASLPLRIEPGSDLSLKAELDKRQRGRFTIDSESPGAAVYLDGEYLGAVPLELEGFSDTKVLRVVAQGKEALQLPLQGSPPSGSISLPPLEELGLGYKARIGEAKDQFYGALGWFVLSLPVSVLSLGSFRMYYDAGAAAAPIITDQEAIDSLNTRYIVSQSVFWASSAVSAGLAVNAVIKLIRYIRAAN